MRNYDYLSEDPSDMRSEVARLDARISELEGAEEALQVMEERAVAAEQQCERILKALKHIQSTTSDSYCEEVARDALIEFKTRVK